MAAAGKSEDSPLSSEFEDLGLEEEGPTSTSNNSYGQSEWTEGEEVSNVQPTSSSHDHDQATGSEQQQEVVTSEIEPQADGPRVDRAHIASGSYTDRRASGVRHSHGQPDDKIFHTLRELEDAGHKVADYAKNAASDVTRKLFGGAGSNGGGAGGEESFSIGKLAEGVSSWWSSLDPTQIVEEAPNSTTSLAQAKTDAQQLFGLPATEELLEKFACTLVQTYHCRHNVFTGPREVTWRGMLYITDNHSCWKADADSTTLMLPHSDVANVEKLEAFGKSSSGALRVKFGDEGEFLVLRDFVGGAEDLNGALALLEHVIAAE